MTRAAWRDVCIACALMHPHLQVTFERRAQDPSVEASAHRWVTRLESAGVPIRRAFLVIEQAGRRRAVATLRLELADGAVSTVAASREDTYVAVADAFRAALRQRLDRGGAADRPRFGIGSGIGLAG